MLTDANEVVINRARDKHSIPYSLLNEAEAQMKTLQSIGEVLNKMKKPIKTGDMYQAGFNSAINEVLGVLHLSIKS